MTYALLITAFIISTCGLIYELIASTVASYLLGDSVTQFSTVIGVYLFSMGVGSFLSKYIGKNVVFTFIQVEMLVGLVGGCSAAILFSFFEQVENFRILLYSLVGIIGILIGLEIPLLMRVLKNRLEFKDLVSQVFTFDYVGALLASLLFPLVLVPYLGLLRASFLFGLLNVFVSLWTIHLFRDELPWLKALRSTAIILIISLTCGFVYSERIVNLAESANFQETIIYSTSTPYQRIVVTGGRDMKLFLNGNLQFNSRDEYRYHEALVHPALSGHPNPRKVLVLGGGDGMAVRELLKHPSIENITLVDLDPEMTSMFKNQELFAKLNDHSLSNSKVTIINQDAFNWLRKCNDRFDVAIVDFPDPSNYSLGKLYTDTFYKALRKVLNEDGLTVIQSTSPYYAKNSYWCVVTTLNSIGMHTTPYHAYVPSFGDWGYVIASNKPFDFGNRFPGGLRYVSPETVALMKSFPKDMLPTERTVNKLNNQSLVHLFESEWSQYVESN